MKSLNVIGCGKAARTIVRRFAEGGVFEIKGVLNRSAESAENAVRFIGSGRALASLAELAPAEVLLIGVTDDAIAEVCSSGAAAGALVENGIAFHLSGALPSTILRPLESRRTARLAAVHPMRSFADPQIAYEAFPGTDCAIEGEKEALALLQSAFGAIGAECFTLDAERKTAYHAGAVMLSNYLVALADAGLELFLHAGIAPEKAVRLASAMTGSTLANIERLGPAKALTGPITRGDVETVRRQLEFIDHTVPDLGAIYRRLGLRCLRLSATLAPAQAAEIARLLEAEIVR